LCGGNRVVHLHFSGNERGGLHRDHLTIDDV
jgi:hypothetical protein